jgi:glycosyltransferase involved in cell wall biosynthesis
LPCPGVVTVHDLAFLRLPHVVSPQRHRYLSQAIAASVQRAAAIIAVSAATRADLLTTWGVPPERVAVVYPAIDPALGPITDGAACAAFRRRVGVSRPYILFLGTLEPRKNLATLIDAFALARERGLRDHELILVGGTDWDRGNYADALRAQIARRKLGDCVRLAGYAAMADRPLWYACATVLAMPSWYEGFGFPVAEAMACGVPVIASNAGSLPEVVGDAGQLCDPADVDAWAAALCRVASDPTCQARARQSASVHAARFTEAALAQGTLGVYDQIVSSNASPQRRAS